MPSPRRLLVPEKWRRLNDEVSPDEFIFHLKTWIPKSPIEVRRLIESDYALTDSLRIGISAGTSCCTSSECAIVTPMFAR
jgi:hypothetical protein